MGLVNLPDHVLNKIADPSEKQRLGKAGLTIEERTLQRDKRHESELRGEVIGFCKRHGIIVDAADPSRRSGLPIGRPDLLLTKNCRCLYIELKTAYNQLSPEQKSYIDELVDAGNCVVVCRDYPSATCKIIEFFGL